LTKKFKIAFFLDDKDFDIDLSSPELGNPGIGGTDYLMVSTPFYLNKYKAKDILPIIYHTNVNTRLPSNLETVLVDNRIDAADHAIENFVDLLVYRPYRDTEKEFLNKIKSIKLKCVAWIHVSPKADHIRQLAKSTYIKAAICVEQEQHDQFYDSPLCHKLSFIQNGFDVNAFAKNVEINKNEKSVVFVGGLFPQKNFHYLAKQWPNIIKICPDAKLYVIGSAQLYDNSIQLGKYGVATESYEKTFIKYLKDKNGEILPSVKFMGKLGINKKKIMSSALVGVGNPIGTGENCPGVLLEFQSLGVPVVSLDNYGSIDTIDHNKTGFLAKNDKEFVNYICKLLIDKKLNDQLSNNCSYFIKKKFSYEKITTQWLELIQALENKKSITKSMKSNYFKHFKWFIYLNSFIQKFLGKYIKWPFLIEIKSIIKKIITKG